MPTLRRVDARTNITAPVTQTQSEPPIPGSFFGRDAQRTGDRAPAPDCRLPSSLWRTGPTTPILSSMKALTQARTLSSLTITSLLRASSIFAGLCPAPQVNPSPKPRFLGGISQIMRESNSAGRDERSFATTTTEVEYARAEFDTRIV